jgi:hypothetical protein
MPIDIVQAKAKRAAQAQVWSRQVAEFEVTRPTPTRAENHATVAGDLVLLKNWDLSPISNAALDATEPPGRPDDGRPVNTTRPVILAPILRAGSPVTTDNGAWDNTPDGYTYQWRRGVNDTAGAPDIAGATDPSYVLTDVDLGFLISCRVTARNAVGPASAVSLGVGPILPGPPVGLLVPTVWGPPEVGETLSATPGAWNNAPGSYAWEWRRDLTTIENEVSPTYTVTSDDEGFVLSVGVRGINAGGPGSTLFSTPVGPIGARTAPTDPPVNVTLPVVTGLTVVGETLLSSVGTWLNSPRTYARQWRRDAVDIAGATAVSYLCLPADLDAMMSVRVTATNEVGSADATSLEVGPVTDVPVEGLPPVNATPPIITGLALVGETLSVSTGTWTNDPTSFAYEWRRNAFPIVGATGPTLDLEAIDEGYRIYCVVTATNANGAGLAQSSPNVGPVIAEGLPYCTALPVVTGDPRVGETLTTTDGATWVNAPTRFTYQWTRNGILISAYEATFELTRNEITAVIASRVTGHNALGSASFNSVAVGPIVPAGVTRRDRDRRRK